MVGLFSSHANKLGEAHGHLVHQSSDLAPVGVTVAPPRSTSPRVSGAKAQQIAKGYEARLTVYELAMKHGVHRATVSEVLRRNGIAMRRQSPTEAQVNEMVRLYQEGLSLQRVGDRLGFNASTVLNKLRARGITTRDSHGRGRSVAA